jgi:phage gp37-like protein
MVPFSSAVVLTASRRARRIVASRDGITDRQRHATRSVLRTVVAEF